MLSKLVSKESWVFTDQEHILYIPYNSLALVLIQRIQNFEKKSSLLALNFLGSSLQGFCSLMFSNLFYLNISLLFNNFALITHHHQCTRILKIQARLSADVFLDKLELLRISRILASLRFPILLPFHWFSCIIQLRKT